MSTHSSIEPSAVSVLTTYAFPKLCQYYTSKGKTCILEQYQNEIIQYFMHNKLKLQKFYTSSITKNNFISSLTKYIDNKNGTQNHENSELKTAIKRLYTILQLHKHAITSQPTLINNNIPRLTHSVSVTNIKKRERERMDVIHQLSARQSELSNLEQTVNLLKHMKEQNEQKYKQNVTQLQQQLNSEKTHVDEIMNANKQLQNMNQQLLDELNAKNKQFASVNQQLKKHEQYQKMINDLKNELQTKEAQINQMDEDFVWRKQLDLGSNLDCLNDEFVWWPCTVIDIDSNNNKIKIRYDAFDDDFVQSDEWIDKTSSRLAPYMTKAKDIVDIDVITENPQMSLKPVAKSEKNKKIYKQGFLVKQGSLFKSYKTRYFRLLEDGNMCYYKTMTDTVTIGQFNIKNMIETRKIKFPKNKNLFGFEIVTQQNKHFRFQTDSNETCAEWIDVIHALVEELEQNENIIDENMPEEHGIEITSSDEILSHSNASDEMKELKLKDFKLNDSNSNINDANIEYDGWMYCQGKWDTNWTHRYCVLAKEPLTLKCYIEPGGKVTRCMKLSDIKSCAILPGNSEKFCKLEIPTMFAFYLVTDARIYTFACRSKLDVNLWMAKIKMFCVFDVTLREKSDGELTPRRSSIVEIGCSLNKLATSFGRLIGVTEEHVTTTQVVEKKSCYSPVPQSPTNVTRRSSVPVVSMWNKKQNFTFNMKDLHGRRRSAPHLTSVGLGGLGNGSSMWVKQHGKEIKNGLKQEIIEQNLERKHKLTMNSGENDSIEDDSDDISDLDQYDD